eukprot:2588646-Pyramimonas_sp.AAC.2
MDLDAARIDAVNQNVLGRDTVAGRKGRVGGHLPPEPRVETVAERADGKRLHVEQRKRHPARDDV